MSLLPTQFQDVLHLLIESARPNPSVNADAPVHARNSASTCGGAPLPLFVRHRIATGPNVGALQIQLCPLSNPPERTKNARNRK